MIKLIIKFNMHLAVESLAGKENKKTCWKLVQVLWDSFVHFSGYLFSFFQFWILASEIRIFVWVVCPTSKYNVSSIRALDKLFVNIVERLREYFQ